MEVSGTRKFPLTCMQRDIPSYPSDHVRVGPSTQQQLHNLPVALSLATTGKVESRVTTMRQTVNTYIIWKKQKV